MKINIKYSLGIILIVVGALILLQSLNLFQGQTGNIVWLVVFAVGSVYSFVLFSRRKLQFLWMVVGIVSLSLAAGNLVSLFDLPDWLHGTIALAGLALGFILVYADDRINWWALIPASIFVSLGVINYLETTGSAAETDGIIFFGLGAAFILLFILPAQYGRMNWALVPGVVLIGIGFLFTYGTDGEFVSLIGPGILLLSGILVLYFALRK